MMGSAAVSLRLNMEGMTEGRPAGVSESSGSTELGREGRRGRGACSARSQGTGRAAADGWWAGERARIAEAGIGGAREEGELVERTVSGLGREARGGTGARAEGGGKRAVTEEPRGRLVGTGAGSKGGAGD